MLRVDTCFVDGLVPVLGGSNFFFLGENQQFQFFITKCENQFGSCLLSFLETVNVLIKFA
jgi:hypothetical protein